MAQSRTARTAHTRQKPKPRLVSKAHQLELDEQQAELDAARRAIKRTKRVKPARNTGA